MLPPSRSFSILRFKAISSRLPRSRLPLNDNFVCILIAAASSKTALFTPETLFRAPFSIFRCALYHMTTMPILHTR